MKTIKEVADLAGVSVRTLQYYDEIGVFRPSEVTKAGYRLYDENALNTLQQILLFRELDFPLKEIKTIMESPHFDRIEAYKNQKALLTAKRDRLNKLLNLLDKLEKGESCMSFKEFDLSEYIRALEEFRDQNQDQIVKYWGSREAFDDFIQKARDHEVSIGSLAEQYYGSVEKYTEAMKESLLHFSENMEKMQQIKEKGYVEQNKELMEKLVQDLTQDPRSDEIQTIIDDMVHLLSPEDTPTMQLGENYYDILIDHYLHNQPIIEAVDKQYEMCIRDSLHPVLSYRSDSFSAPPQKMRGLPGGAWSPHLRKSSGRPASWRVLPMPCELPTHPEGFSPKYWPPPRPSEEPFSPDPPVPVCGSLPGWECGSHPAGPPAVPLKAVLPAPVPPSELPAAMY